MFCLLAVVAAGGAGAVCGEVEAIAISRNIQARHLPHGTILDPVMASGGVVSYSRCGDSAIWTGHYLAAEAFRYRATNSPEALANAAGAVRGLRLLADITGTDLLARCAFPADAPWAIDLAREEAHHGIRTAKIDGREWWWVGNTSRDQYSGAFFGLAVAWDLLDDAALREEIRTLTGRLLGFLLRHGWLVVMPEGGASTAFLGRPDQQLALLQIGRHMDPDRFGLAYRILRATAACSTVLPVFIDTLDPHSSYFKFNLDAINLYNLLRLEDGGFYRFWYREAYDALRRAVSTHGNPHFNMIDRALKGPDAMRDAETVALLEEWPTRPRADEPVDWRGAVAACGEDRACDPLPVAARVRTDFLWQRSPFLLYGGGEGAIEGPGIDYILPYWMARCYGVLPHPPATLE